MKARIYIVIGLIISLGSCKGSDPDINNPYDNQEIGEEHEKVVNGDSTIDPASIRGLHKFVFKPTCANSGCHDGNFEPDFRTIESSYNTMVGQPIIKNDDMNPLTARVTPGNAATSMLIRRLEVDLNGNSGIMPLVTEPNSDWPIKKLEYIENIKKWIDNGALDQFGNAPTASDFPVQLKGITAKVNGNIVSRSSTYYPLQIPGGAGQVELWFAFEDDNKSPDQLSNLSLDLSIIWNDFDSSHVTPLTYSATPVTVKGYDGEDANHHHRAIVNLSDWNSGDVVWIRTRVSDGVNESELPNNNSLFRAKQYATMKLN